MPAASCLALPLPQEERGRLQALVGDLESSVAALQQQEAAGEGQLAAALAAAEEEAAALRARLAEAGQAGESLREELAEVKVERQRLEGKVQKHKQVRGVCAGIQDGVGSV